MSSDKQQLSTKCIVHPSDHMSSSVSDLCEQSRAKTVVPYPIPLPLPVIIIKTAENTSSAHLFDAKLHSFLAWKERQRGTERSMTTDFSRLEVPARRSICPEASRNCLKSDCDSGKDSARNETQSTDREDKQDLPPSADVADSTEGRRQTHTPSLLEEEGLVTLPNTMYPSLQAGKNEVSIHKRSTSPSRTAQAVPPRLVRKEEFILVHKNTLKLVSQEPTTINSPSRLVIRSIPEQEESISRDHQRMLRQSQNQDLPQRIKSTTSYSQSRSSQSRNPAGNPPAKLQKPQLSPPMNLAHLIGLEPPEDIPPNQPEVYLTPEERQQIHRDLRASRARSRNTTNHGNGQIGSNPAQNSVNQPKMPDERQKLGKQVRHKALADTIANNTKTHNPPKQLGTHPTHEQQQQLAWKTLRDINLSQQNEKAANVCQDHIRPSQSQHAKKQIHEELKVKTTGIQPLPRTDLSATSPPRVNIPKDLSPQEQEQRLEQLLKRAAQNVDVTEKYGLPLRWSPREMLAREISEHLKELKKTRPTSHNFDLERAERQMGRAEERRKLN